MRFFGIGGKRNSIRESFVDCALREGKEEIGNVVSHLKSADRTYFLQANGRLKQVHITDEVIQPRLIWEKFHHSNYGSMAQSKRAYYLVAFNAELQAQPRPLSEIAALLYLTDAHLLLMRSHRHLLLSDLVQSGANIEWQAGISVPQITRLEPHGTAQFLVNQEPPVL